jgi:hypothetical protein
MHYLYNDSSTCILESDFQADSTYIFVFLVLNTVGLSFSFHNDVLIVRAIRKIPKGGQIYTCYGPHYKKMDTAERQQILKDQYYFICKCEPCLHREDRTFYQVCFSSCFGL